MGEGRIITEVSIHTVKWVLHKSDLNRCVAAQKLSLTKKHQIRQKNIHYGIKEKWTKVIYSDKDKIELNSVARGYVFRQIGTKNKKIQW